MQKTILVSIPQPCHEDWSNMSPQGNGRHCNSCNKIVVDFTKMDHEDLLEYLRSHAGKGTCGRFKSSQLTMPAPAPSLPVHPVFSKFRRMTALLMAGFAFLASACKPGLTGKPTVGEIAVDSSMTVKPVSADTASQKVEEPRTRDEVKDIQSPPPVNFEEFHTKGNWIVTETDELPQFPPLDTTILRK